MPVQSAGCRARNVVAFLRRASGSSALVVVPRWLTRFPEEPGHPQDWCDTRIILPSGSAKTWKSILSPQQIHSEPRDDESTLMLNDLLRDFPVAFLEASEHSQG